MDFLNDKEGPKLRRSLPKHCVHFSSCVLGCAYQGDQEPGGGHEFGPGEKVRGVVSGCGEN